MFHLDKKKTLRSQSSIFHNPGVCTSCINISEGEYTLRGNAILINIANTFLPIYLLIRFEIKHLRQLNHWMGGGYTVRAKQLGVAKRLVL